MNIGLDEVFIKKLGKGLAFPIVLENGKARLSTGVELIRSSIRAILYWPRGTRFFNEDFGSLLLRLLQQPNDSQVKSLVVEYVFNSISKYEKRVTMLDASISNESDKLLLRVTYRITNSNLEDSFIIPFYKESIY